MFFPITLYIVKPIIVKMIEKSKSCKDCQIQCSQINEKDFESIIEQANQIDIRPLNIQLKFMKKMEYLGIKDKILNNKNKTKA